MKTISLPALLFNTSLIVKKSKFIAYGIGECLQYEQAKAFVQEIQRYVLVRRVYTDSS